MRISKFLLIPSLICSSSLCFGLGDSCSQTSACSGGGNVTCSATGDTVSCSGGGGSVSCSGTTTTTGPGPGDKVTTTRTESKSCTANDPAITVTLFGRANPDFFRTTVKKPSAINITGDIVSLDDKHTIYDIDSTRISIDGVELEAVNLLVAPPATNENVKGHVHATIVLNDELKDKLSVLPVGPATILVMFHNKDNTRFIIPVQIEIKD